MASLAAPVILTAFAACALGGAGCNSEPRDVLLANLRSPTLEVDVSDVDEIDVLIRYAGAVVGGQPVCPTIRSGLQATLNGRAMNPVDWNTGPSVGRCQAGPCVECSVNLMATGAASLASPQGNVEVIIADESATLALSASGVLLPSVISLPAAQSAQVRASAIIMVMVDLSAREPPLSMPDLVLEQRTARGVDQVEAVSSNAGGGLLRVGFPLPLAGPAVLQATSRSWRSSPSVFRCEGVARCSAASTNIVGTIPLVLD